MSKAIIEKMLFKDILDHQFDEGSKVFKVLDKSGMPSVTCRSVQHCQQQFNWDCGLSCVLMALDAADLLEVKDTILANIEEICRKEGFGHSTWSIDLCYLIKHYAPQLRFSYTTITIGVDPSYMNQVSLKKDIDKVVLCSFLGLSSCPPGAFFPRWVQWFQNRFFRDNLNCKPVMKQ